MNFKKSLSAFSVAAMLLPVVTGGVVSASHVHNHADQARTEQVYRHGNRAKRRLVYKINKMIHFGMRLRGYRYNEAKHISGAHKIARGVKSETDTTGFTWGLLKYAGFKVPKEVFIVGPGGSENRFFKRHHETVPARKAKRGTIVMANAAPHNAILLQRWHGKNTKVLEQGGAHNNVNVETYGEAFGHWNHPSEFANPVLR